MSLDIDKLSESWKEKWGDSSLLADRLKYEHGDKFLRFYSLPDGKRYADNDKEATKILFRQNILISDLTESHSNTLLLILPQSSNSKEVEPLDKNAQVGKPQFWKTINGDESETDPAMKTYNHMYVSSFEWHEGAIDNILSQVSEDVIWGVIIAPLDFSFIYHPYDGGSDVFSTSQIKLDELRVKYPDWVADSL